MHESKTAVSPVGGEIEMSPRCAASVPLSIIKASRVLARAACCPIWVRVRTLKTAKWSEHSGWINMHKLFLPLSLMLPSDKFVEPKYFVASCKVSIPKLRSLVRFSKESGPGLLKWTIFCGYPHNMRSFSLKALIRPKNLIISLMEQWGANLTRKLSIYTKK